MVRQKVGSHQSRGAERVHEIAPRSFPIFPSSQLLDRIVRRTEQGENSRGVLQLVLDSRQRVYALFQFRQFEA